MDSIGHLISIVIPAYNVEEYIDECISSIIRQDYGRYEVILVDDGSTDHTPDIIDTYCRKDTRFKLIRKANSGVSSTRNVRLRHCSGDIIIFVDSDDYMAPNALSVINDSFKEGCLLCFGYYRKQRNGVYEVIADDKNVEASAKEHIYLWDTISGYLWNKAFRADVIKSHDLYMNEDVHYCEDLLFVHEYLKHCPVIKYVPQSLYYYRLRKSSASFDIDTDKFTSILKVYRTVIDECDDLKIQDWYSYLYAVCIYSYKLGAKGDPILEAEKEWAGRLTSYERAKLFMVKYLRPVFLLIKALRDRYLSGRANYY